MHKINLQNFFFTALMVFCMALPISVYNNTILSGIFGKEILILSFQGLLIPYFFAIIYESLIAKPLAFRFAGYLLKYSYPSFIQKGIMTLCMVSFMSTTMTCFITFLQHRQGWDFVACWGQLLIQTFPFAFLWQLLFAGPLVRKVNRILFE